MGGGGRLLKRTEESFFLVWEGGAAWSNPEMAPSIRLDRHNGQITGAKPCMDNVNWTKGIDQKTGKPLDYDPAKDIQIYAGIGNLNPGEPLKKLCPSQAGGNNYWPSSYDPNTKLLYIPALTACVNVSIDREKHNKERGWNGGPSPTTERFESNPTAVDPVNAEVTNTV